MPSLISCCFLERTKSIMTDSAVARVR
jgi:hypothetical protein